MTDRFAAYTRLDLDYPAARVLRITFNRPETYNSVDAETHTQLTHIWRDIDADPDISAVIVTGAGKAFSAGGDFLVRAWSPSLVPLRTLRSLGNAKADDLAKRRRVLRVDSNLLGRLQAKHTSPNM